MLNAEDSRLLVYLGGLENYPLNDGSSLLVCLDVSNLEHGDTFSE